MAQTVFAYAALALTATLPVAIAEAWPDERKQTETEIVRSSGMVDSSTKEENNRVKGEVPQAILEAILKEVAALARVGPDQVAIARAESVVWSDGSLGCPEPGMAYTQALVNGYWVVIDAAGQRYDFRVDSRGNFRLCPPGQGHPPSQPAAN
jgi:hypothetical protein